MKTDCKMLFGAVLLILFLDAIAAAGPFAPAAGQPGSTAIHMSDSMFSAWATGVVVERGYKDISHPEFGLVSGGDEADCLGQTTGQLYEVVSLGDGGIATLTFANPITNGHGYDFAVFENSYNDTFLELAFVEVSSDGENFFRFDSVSLTEPNEQVGGFETLDTTDVNNLAGKYRLGYGTPFELEELAGIDGLDVSTITHVRIIDVVGCTQSADFNNDRLVMLDDFAILSVAYGSEDTDENWDRRCDIARGYNIIDVNDVAQFMFQWLTEWSSMDSLGNKINDPWPTDFDVGGFDLDAVGVINEKAE